MQRTKLTSYFGAACYYLLPYSGIKEQFRQPGEPDARNKFSVAEITVVQKQHQGTHRKTGGIRFPAAFCYFFRKK